MPCTKDRTPSWLQKLTFIKRYALDSCSTTWSLYFQMGGKAVQNLALTATFMGMDDLARSFFRPKLGRSRMHSMTRFGRGRSRVEQQLLLETSDLVADATRVTADLKRPVYGAWPHFLWEIDTALQKQLGRIVLVNMATDFAYDWFSGILEAPESKCHLGRFRYITHPTSVGGHPYENHPVHSWVYAEGECAKRIDGVYLQEGTWVITLIFDAGDFTPSNKGGDWYYRFVLGAFDPQQCGESGHIHLPNGNSTERKRLTWVMKGPDYLRLQTAAVPGNGGTSVGTATGNVRGFRID